MTPSATTLQIVLDLLQFDRQQILAGELWRLWTGHFIHWSSSHLAWDLVAFVVLATLVASDSVRAMVSTTLFSAVVVSLALLILQPSIELYRGLSGIDAALFVFVACSRLQRASEQKDPKQFLLLLVSLLLFAAKITFEGLSHSTVFAQLETRVTVVPLAHLAGAAAGFCAWKIRQHAPLAIAAVIGDRVATLSKQER
jgi:rhomboid family GlyGly-CTERM serine protease